MNRAGHGVRSGGPDDFYVTPAWSVNRLLETQAFRCPRAGSLPEIWVEPGCGNGAIISAVNNHRESVGLVRPRWFGVECDIGRSVAADIIAAKKGDYIYTGDYLSISRTSLRPLFAIDANMVIGNPPYYMALEFAEHTLSLFHDATVAFLLRMGFATSARRSGFMRTYTPDVYVLPNRPSFTPDGKTDSSDYAWFVWPYPTRQRPSGRFEVLAETPAEERHPAVAMRANE